jgi:hypothetical protein
MKETKVGRSLKAQFDDLLHSSFVFILVGSVDIGGFAVGRGVGVGVSEQRTDGGQHGPDVVDGAPLVLKDWVIIEVLSRQILPSA